MKWILDPGHGGMAFGHYMTPGKRSPQVPPGIYEGEFNRAIANSVHDGNYLETIVTNPGPINISLKKRVSFVNSIKGEKH
jgi:N-acetylmuramoyl-L-alanine amidase